VGSILTLLILRAKMTKWQKSTTTIVMAIGTLLFAYAGFDSVREYGIFWQLIAMAVGALIGIVGGFILCIYIFSNFSDSDSD
jgi:hypothetical protein